MIGSPVKVQVEQQAHEACPTALSSEWSGRMAPSAGFGATLSPSRTPEGEVTRVAGLAEDVADRKRIEEALRESEERFRGTFENAAIGIAHVDAEGRFLLVNDKLCDFVGYTREELLVRGFQDITHPEDLAASLDHFLSLMRGELPASRWKSDIFARMARLSGETYRYRSRTAVRENPLMA